jgi:hypothetical protein
MVSPQIQGWFSLFQMRLPCGHQPENDGKDSWSHVLYAGFSHVVIKNGQ